MEPITLSGTPYEQGVQHGAALGSEMRAIFGPRTRDRSGWNGAAVAERLGQLHANMERRCPRLVEEMHGIADGAQLPFDEVLLYNCLADIALIQLFCTTVGFASTPDGPAIGKTNDIGRDAQRCHVLFRRTDGAGLPLLWVTWPGTVWANCFVNGAGLAYGGASVRKLVRDPDGISSNVLLRALADTATSVDDALRLLREIPIMHNPINLMLADAGGALCVAEKAPLALGVRAPAPEGVLIATNEFRTPELRGSDDNDPEFGRNSRNRYENLLRLTADGARTVARLQEILADHREPGGICQHGAQEMWTTVAYVAVPRTRTLHFACGRPCEVPFETFAL